jgi:hypothetical protein
MLQKLIPRQQFPVPDTKVSYWCRFDVMRANVISVQSSILYFSMSDEGSVIGEVNRSSCEIFLLARNDANEDMGGYMDGVQWKWVMDGKLRADMPHTE